MKKKEITKTLEEKPCLIDFKKKEENTKKCYLIYENGYLSCTAYHKRREECLLNYNKN